MGGLTYGTYGAGGALTVIGLCTFWIHLVAHQLQGAIG
jgi:hypothetical protein